MRQLLMVAIVLGVVGVTQARADDKAEIKGPHICCPMCVKSVEGILGKVEGVAKVECSVPNKTVTFTAKDKATAEKALDAMIAGGFSGTCKFGDATITRPAAKVEGKGDEVVVKGVHACCRQCTNAITGLFPDAKVGFGGTGVQRDVTITGKDLDFAVVMKALIDKGFSGKIEKK
jgi:copper chaperone CopZ